MDIIDVLEVIGGVIGILAIIIVIWDLFKDDRLLVKQVQAFYEDIEHFIFAFIQYCNDNIQYTRLKSYYEGKMRQNFERFSNYLGLSMVEENGEFFYYNMSDYILQKSGGLFYKARPDENYFNEQSVIVNQGFPADAERLDAVIESVNEFLKGLRDFWNKFYYKRLFRKNIKPKLNYYKILRNNKEILGN
ncbi:hypothetical protein ES703_29199 [subsurface metagenome]